MWTLRTHESQSPALPWLRLPPESSDCTGQGGCPLGSWGSLGCGGCLGLFPLLVRRLRDLKSEVWMEKELRAPACSGLRAPPGAVGGGGLFGIELIYSVELVSAVPQSNSVIDTLSACSSPLTFIPGDWV